MFIQVVCISNKSSCFCGLHPPLYKCSTLCAGLSGVSEWWGNKRLDYALYYPEALRSFPSLILPALLHSSYWENYDVAAFVVQQVSTSRPFSPPTTHRYPN